MILPTLDQVEKSLGDNGKAWRKAYDAFLRDADACSNVGIMCEAFGSASFAVRIRHGYEPSLTDERMLRLLHRHADALTAAVEPVTQNMDDVSDLPLFTGIPENVKQ